MMRYVNLNQVRRFAKGSVLDELNAAKAELETIDDDATRRTYMTTNSPKCSAIQHALWIIGFGKCWYSEAVLCADEGEVEHFRPKKRVSKSQPAHGGYYWRAFDWRNLRLAHPLVNKRQINYSTDKVAGKGCYFPLRNEANRAVIQSEEYREEPILLDPTVAQDCRLICFDDNSGKPIPRVREGADAWRYLRAKESISYYNLDNGTWNGIREDLMREVNILCDKTLEAAASKDWVQYEELLDEVATLVHPFAQFSSAAIQVVRAKGLLN